MFELKPCGIYSACYVNVSVSEAFQQSRFTSWNPDSLDFSSDKV